MKPSIADICRSNSCVYTGIAMFFLVNVLFSESSPEELINARKAIASDSFSLLQSGDKAYASGDLTTAVRDFQKGFGQLSEGGGTLTLTLKAELADRYGTAASQEAKRLMRIGDREEAKALLETVLSEDVAPNNQAALRALEKLNDPISSNPALTKAFVQDVDQVRRLLYQAEGAYNLGKFDKAEEQYKRVLQVDSYNKAARRGLERVTQRKANYYRASYDSARAKMLSEVDKQWELNAVTPRGNSEIMTEFNADQAVSSLSNKLDTIILPRVDFQGEDIYEVIDTLRALSRSLASDSLYTNSGLQFVLKIPENSEVLSKRITLNLSNVPLRKVIESVASDLGLSVSVDDYAIVLSSNGDSNDSLSTRSFNVSPNFLSRSAKKEQPSDDPFSLNEESPDGGLRGKRLTAREILEDFGIQFEGSAIASFLPSTSTLIVKNTSAQLNALENVIQALAREQPVMIALETKLISVQAFGDEELSTDWTVEGTILNAIANGIGLSAGTVGNGKTNEGITGSPLTAGNRSGGTATVPNSIDLVTEREIGEPGRVQANYDPFIFANTGDRQDALLSGIISDPGSLTTNNQNFAPSPGVFSVSAGLDSATVNAMLRGLSQKKGTDFLIKPSITTRSGQLATVEIGKEFTYVSEYEPPEISQGTPRNDSNISNGEIDDLLGVEGDPTWYYIWDPDDLEILDAEIDGVSYQSFTSAVTPSHPSTFKTVILGTELEIQPTLDENGKTISLSINSVYRDFDGFINYGFPINAFSTEIKFQQSYIDDNIDFLTQELPPELDAFISFGSDEFPDPGAPFQENILEVQERFFQATPNFILMPVFQTIRAQTNVTVYDGATLILGGLINSTRRKLEDKVPILGSLPLIGKAFTSEIDQTVKKQILLAITAKVIDPTGRPIHSSF